LKKLGEYIKHWSYSLYGQHKKCPAAVKYSKIDKLQGPSVPAMERGTMIHSLAEHYLTGGITGGVPPQLRKLEYEFKTLKRMTPVCEKFWGLDVFWQPMDYGWVVAKTDAFVPPTKKDPILINVDHKTGREYAEHVDQSELYSAIGFGLYPQIEEVETCFFYIDQGYVKPYFYTRKQLKELVLKWLDRGKKLMATRNFLPTPSREACGWCGFRSDKLLANGKPGPCQAWKVVRNLQ
jgi:hypothetical protein